MKLIYISNASFSGSGYLRISLPLMDEFEKLGHDIKFIGLQYKGECHEHEYGIIPAGKELQQTLTMCQHMDSLFNPDAYVIALDIPYCGFIPAQLRSAGVKKPIAGIFPIESGPLSPTWGGKIAALSTGFCISRFGTDMARMYNPNIRYLPMGITDDFYVMPDKLALRKKYGIREDAFVILTVAENQERKNLSAAMDIVKGVGSIIDKPVVYILVTTKDMPVGWTIDDYWYETDSDVDFRVIERGIGDDIMREYYNVADTFLITSKAEGWCMPITEAIACGCPVVGGDHTGIAEQLRGCHYGLLVPEEYRHRDVWQNAERFYIDRGYATDVLIKMACKEIQFNDDERLQWLGDMSWAKSALILEEGLKNVTAQK